MDIEEICEDRKRMHESRKIWEAVDKKIREQKKA